MFGTFRDKLKEHGTSYKGGSEEKVDAKAAAVHDSKELTIHYFFNSLKGLFCMTHVIFMPIELYAKYCLLGIGHKIKCLLLYGIRAKWHYIFNHYKVELNVDLL